MSSNKLPFYAQAALLESYAKDPDPSADPDAVEVVLELLPLHHDLRHYFFRSGPSPAWAQILWDNGFLGTAPEPVVMANGYSLPVWEAQTFLITVAYAMPDVVQKHLESVKGHPFYIAHAVEAATRLEIDDLLPIFDILVRHIRTPGVLGYVYREVERLLYRLLEAGQTDYAFVLWGNVIGPIDDTPADTNLPKTLSSNLPDWYEEKLIEQLATIFANIDIERTVLALENQLLETLNLEGGIDSKAAGLSQSWWRSAIEDSDQDVADGYKDELLKSLRNTLEIWVSQNPAAAEPVILRYLNSETSILRRLGLHILNKFPELYKQHVQIELLELHNLDDGNIHHEFFLLLKQGTGYLDDEARKQLIRNVLNGPPHEILQKLSELASKRNADEVLYQQTYVKSWIRDRLLAIQDFLSEEEDLYLTSLLNELGTPSHPEFLVGYTGFYAVTDVSALSDSDVLEKSPDELVDYLENWKPPQRQSMGPEQISLRGLALQVARLVVRNISRYGDVLTVISQIEPEFAYAIIDLFKDDAEKRIPWATKLLLCESLINKVDALEDKDELSDTNWGEVGKQVIRLLETGFDENVESKAIPIEYMPQVRNILLKLVYNPDPAPSVDRPEPGKFGHNEPFTIAINSVRPSALSALILYARYRLVLLQQETELIPEVVRVEEEVLALLTQKVDYTQDTSWALHSMFGRHLNLLHSLAPKWVEEHLDMIFPESENEDDIGFFVAAWETYVSFNNPVRTLFGLLFSKYQKAIDYRSKGFKNDRQFESGRRLANHLLLFYLESGTSIYDGSEQSTVLVRQFFTETSPDDRGSAAWLLWHIVPRKPERWSQVKSIWEWRANEASAADHSTDFDRELNWFVKLLEFAPPSENITTLWPLLEASIVHVTRDEPYGIGLESFENFLISQAKLFPLQSIRLYRLILASLFTNKEAVYLDKERSTAILETTCKFETSKQDTLSTIDFLARHGHHQFKRIYDACINS